MQNPLLRIFALLLVSVLAINAQVNPTPFSLAGGNYSFTSWANTNPAGTFPPNMVFRTHSVGSDPTTNNYATNGNYNGAYNLLSNARVAGVGTVVNSVTVTQGFVFINTGTAGASINPSTLVTGTGFQGTCDLALNTTGRANVQVAWVAQTVSSAARIFNLELQYRVGTTNAFVSAGPTQIYTNPANSSATTTQSFNFTLPAECNNQPVVELRWVYYYTGTGTGNRPGVGLASVNVTSSPISNATRLSLANITPANLFSNGNNPGVFPNNTTARVTMTNGFNTQTFDVTLNQNQFNTPLTAFFNGNGSTTITAIDLATSNPLISASPVVVNIAPAPAQLVLDTVRAAWWTGSTIANREYGQLPNFTIRAIDANNNIVTGLNNYNATVSFISTGASFTRNVNLVNGQATVNNIIFTTPGNYSVNFTINSSPLMTSNTRNISVNPEVTVDELLIPRYAVGRYVAANAFGVPGEARIPVYAQIRLNNLQPNTYYRYSTGARANGYPTTQPSTYNPFTDDGAGNNSWFDLTTGREWYHSSRNMTSNPTGCETTFLQRQQFSNFTTGPNETSKTLWINIVPSGNVAFTIGGDFYWIFTLASQDGVRIKYNQSTSLTRVLAWGSGASGADTLFMDAGSTTAERMLAFNNAENQAVGIVDQLSPFAPGNYVALYSDSDPTRPLSIARVQGDNNALYNISFNASNCTIFINPYDGPRFLRDIDGVSTQTTPNFFTVQNERATAWGTYIPRRVMQQGSSTVLNSSLNRVRELSAVDGSVIKDYYDADGIWEDDNTNNSTRDKVSPIAFETPFVSIINIPDLNTTTNEFCNKDRMTVNFIAHGVSTVTVNLRNAANTILLTQTINVTRDTNSIVFELGRNTYSLIQARVELLSAEYAWTNTQTPLFRIFDQLRLYTQSQKSVNCTGETRVLAVVADGSNVSYQWTKDGVAIPSATTTNLVLSNLNHHNSGIYNCLIGGYNACGNITTQPIHLYVARGTEITSQPRVQAAQIGEKATFTFDAHVNGLAPDYSINVQWYRGNTLLRDNLKYSGTKSNMFVISNIVDADYSTTADYYAVITGRCGSSTTSRVSLVKNFATVNISPINLLACPNATTRLTANVTSNVPNVELDYQWYKDGQKLTNSTTVAGVNSATLTMTVVTKAMTEGTYFCKVNLLGYQTEITSNSSTISILTNPSILGQSTFTNIQAGKDLALSVSANGDALSYQWFKDGVAIPNSTSATFTKTAVTTADAGTYRVEVSNPCSTISSNTIGVTVTQSIISSVDDIIEINGLTVTPQPINGEANVMFNSTSIGNVKVAINSIVGTELAVLYNNAASLGVNNVTFDVTKLNLATGTYFITLTSGDKTESVRFIVVK